MKLKNKLLMCAATAIFALSGSANANRLDSVTFQDKIEKLRQTADSCLLTKDADPFSSKVGNCYSNIHTQIKSNLNATIQLLKPADKVQYLNTSGAFAIIQKKQCDKMYPESLHAVFANQIAECKLKIDLGQSLIIADKYL